MEEKFQLQIVSCPSCGMKLTKFSQFKSTVTCPRCHSVLKNPTTTAKDEPVPGRMILFSTDQNAFENAMVNALIEQDYVPTNIFECINTDNVFRAYLPMYLYEGNFTASWSCESSYMDDYTKVTSGWDGNKRIESGQKKKWRPQNGNAAGNFAFLCLANEGTDELPEELRNFTSQFPYDIMLSQEFNGDAISADDENLITIPRNADAVLVWQKHGKDLVDEQAQKAALEQIGDQEIRKFRATSSYSLSTKGEYILVPFWFVYYTYNNQRFHYQLDGTGKKQQYSYPINQEEVDFVNGKKRIKTIVSWCWPLALVLWYFTNFSVALVTLIVWFIAKFVVGKMMDSQIKDKLEESRELRREAAKKLG